MTDISDQDAAGSAVDAEPNSRASLGEPFYVVGVGASAGGLEAIRNLVLSIPNDWPHSLVLVQHIPPDYKSMMSDILSRDTNLAVEVVEHGMRIEPSHIYLIPPRYNIVVRQDTGSGSSGSGSLTFSLVGQTPRPGPNLPINLFFHSLAEAAGDRSIAIILSGTGSDGSLGLRHIKDRDGFVMVQSPSTAEFDGMPIAAIDTGVVDLVSDPDAMIIELNRYLEMRLGGIFDVDRLFDGHDETFTSILKIVEIEAEIDFRSYKEPTLKRRIARRMALNKIQDLQAYADLLRENPTEVSILHREFLVGVTNFFRDPTAWQTLIEKVVPEIFTAGDEKEPVKVWSAGCSSGEEAFTIALILEDFRRRHNIERDYRIIATDVNEQAILAAKASVFPKSSLEEIPPTYRNQDYILFQDGTFEIRPEIRKKIIFTVHNVAEDTPFIDTHLLICRNLMIYLGRPLQDHLLAAFSFSLRPNGYLFLGNSESISMDSRSFATVANRTRIFRHTVLERQRPAVVSMAPTKGVRTLPRLRTAKGARRQANDDGTDILKRTLGRLNTCVIVVDELGTVLETFGDHRRYLTVPNDTFSANVFDLVHPHIGRVFSLLLREAENVECAEKLEQKFVDGEGNHLIDVFCERLVWRNRTNAYSLTIRETVLHHGADSTGPTKQDDTEHEGDQSAYVAKLETDLAATQEMLTTSIEDLGVTNEELQTLNEELMAANEELQANNEEVQSVNEELHTVNAENIAKIAQLEAAYLDIENLLNEPVVGKVLLDLMMRIRRFTTGITKYIDLQVHDVGRPLTNFVSNLRPGETAKLLDRIKVTGESGAEFTDEIQTENGSWAMVSVRPFHGNDGGIDGSVVTFIDVTEVKRLEEVTRLQGELKENRDLLEGLIESEAAGYWDWRVSEGVEILSPSLKAMFGYEDDALKNTPTAWQDLVVSEDLPKLVENFKAHVASMGQEPYNCEVRVRHKNGSILWVIRRGRVIEWAEDGSPQRVLGVHIDITELKRRETEVFKRAEEIRRFAFVASHDLMQPLNAISSGLSLLSDEVTEGSAQFNEARGFVENAVERMRSRIGGVFEYARLQDEGLVLEDVDLKQICLSCVNDINDIVQTSGAQIDVGDLPHARATKDLISRVFHNLLTNAIKYGPKDVPPHVSISAGPPTETHVTIRVADNGIGIAPEDYEKVFQLFQKIGSGQDGNGLGLALCDLVISKSGGSIWVEENPGGGTAFVFTLLRASVDKNA